MTKVLANWMASAPKRIPIYGVFVKAEPLDVGKHVDKLYELHSAPENRERFAGLLWKPPKSKEAFEESLRKMIDNEKYEASLNYVYIHLETGQIIGQRSYLQINPKHATIELGRSLMFPQHSRSIASTEAVYLLAINAFKLGYRRILSLASTSNFLSNNAAERGGCQFEGVHRNMRIKQDDYYEQNFIVEEWDNVITSIIDKDFELLKRAYDEWINANNFDENGVQKRRMEEIRRRLYAEASLPFRYIPDVYKTPNAVPRKFRYYPLPSLPYKEKLHGKLVKLEPLEQWHFDGLYSALKDHKKIQTFSLNKPKKGQREMAQWYENSHRWEKKHCYAIVDHNNTRIHGWIRFCDIIVGHGTLGIKAQVRREIVAGQIFAETIYLIGRYVFDKLKYRRLEWVVNGENTHAREILLRHGFAHESNLRNYKIKNGENVDAAVFSITDFDWQQLRSSYGALSRQQVDQETSDTRRFIKSNL